VPAACLSGGCGVQIEPWFTIVVVAC
jgi:hypothetical protein